MSSIKKYVSSLMIAATLTTVQPAPKAEAGIILTPVAVGVALIILGIKFHNKLLIILDADGNVSKDSLVQMLNQRYSFIDNQDVVSNMADLIRSKAASTTDSEGQKTVRLTRGEILSVLAPTGLAELAPAAVEGMIQDLE